MKSSLAVVLILLFGFASVSYAGEKRVKVTHKVEKNGEADKNKKSSAIERADYDERVVNLNDSTDLSVSELLKLKFAGYEKEPNSSTETFIVLNPTEQRILGFKVKINYMDMQGRMLHSRDEELKCDIPPGESRKFDISSWDKQHTYYYYRGNKPKKVATPFQVAIIPKEIKIEEKK